MDEPQGFSYKLNSAQQMWGRRIGSFNPVEDHSSLICFLDGVFRLRLAHRGCPLSEIFMTESVWKSRREN